MDLREQVKNFIRDITTENLIAFFRLANEDYKPREESFDHYLDDDLPITDLKQIGQIDFPEERQLVLILGYVTEDITIRSGKKRQYDLAVKILKKELLDAGIFIFIDDSGNFRFSLVVSQFIGKKRTFTNYRRYTYFVDPETYNRTFIDQIGLADFSSIEGTLDAFSVEKVTKDFFRKYNQVFTEAVITISLDWDDEHKRLFTQRFFNRVLFLTFLEKKGWLKFSDGPDYLQSLFDDYLENNLGNGNFHKDRLNILFFEGLNNPYTRDSEESQKEIGKLIGKVPYLNGGLFEQQADDLDWHFPDEVISNLLDEIVYRFNFTVAESTPMDIEVAVDPEMLGKIFEELVTGRHETGSYYTPKPVVSFMCKEAIKGYLISHLSDEDDTAIVQFVDNHLVENIKSYKDVLNTLRNLKACDPACGSGAYLLGLMHELLDLFAILTTDGSVISKSVYENKLEIIQNNLYGVDIDSFATNIARLRLWLSLVVDFEGESPPPLPNLEYKIEIGDSLTSPNPTGGLDIGFRKPLVDEFVRAKKEYLTSYGQKAENLRSQIKNIRDEIGNWSSGTNGTKGTNSFDWLMEFAEVFVPQDSLEQEMLSEEPIDLIGFDIILANPPYVRADAPFTHIQDGTERQKAIEDWIIYRKMLRGSDLYSTLIEKWDLYVAFLERSYHLLSVDGQMSIIISDSYNSAKYAAASHLFFLKNSKIKRIDFCSDIDLFDAGINNTIIQFEKGKPNSDTTPIRTRRWGDNRENFEINYDELPTGPQQIYGNRLIRHIDITTEFDLTGVMLLDMICYISKGMVINANEKRHKGEFGAVDLLSNVKDGIHNKRFVLGKDLGKWIAINIRYLEWGTRRAPHYFSRPTFPELHETNEKLISMRTPGEYPKVIYDDNSLYFDASSVGFVLWKDLYGTYNRSISRSTKYKNQDPEGTREIREEISEGFNLKFLLALMNSAFAIKWLSNRRQSKRHIYPNDWKDFPIPMISFEEQSKYIELVDEIIRLYLENILDQDSNLKKNITCLEKELDEMILNLYKNCTV